MLCLFVGNAQATSIIVVRTPTVIVLGADSKRIFGSTGKSASACKIGISKNVVWAAAGMVETSGGSFSAHRMAADSIAAPGDLGTRVADFERTVMVKLRDRLNGSTGKRREWILRRVENQPALEVVFAAFEEDVPHIYVTEFYAEPDGITGAFAIRVKRSESPSTTFPNSTIFALGRHKVAEATIHSTPTMWATLGLAGAVRHLIELEIAAGPEEVGPPIAIVKITKKGPHWISQGQCPAG